MKRMDINVAVLYIALLIVSQLKGKVGHYDDAMAIIRG